VSVIIDALRRARRRSEESSAVPTRLSVAPRGDVPSGLGLTPTPVTPRSGRGAWLLVGVVVAISIAGWLAFGRSRAIDSARSSAPTSPQRPPGGPSVPPGATTRATPAPGTEADAAGEVLPTAPESQRELSAATNRPVVPRRETHFSSAVRLHNSGKLDEAATEYLAAIAENDRHVEARSNLGLLYRARGQTTQAVEQFRRALAIDARYVKARNHLAVMLIDSGRLMEARDEIAAGFAVDPRNTDLLVNLALVERAEQHADRAIELLLRAIGDRPTHAAAHYNLGLLYDERNAATLAYTHYVEFLTYSGPEYGGTVVDEVRRRAETLAGRIGVANFK
jgi:Flp pilus assembly protein TadD